MRVTFLVLFQDAYDIKSHGFIMVLQFLLIVSTFADDYHRGRCRFADDM